MKSLPKAFNHTIDKFPRDFWNYAVCPITGFPTREVQVQTRAGKYSAYKQEKRKYYIDSINPKQNTL